MTKTIHNLLFKPGSALVIAVILTSLLAIVGVMFVMVARVDKMATSAIADNKQLNLAVDSVVAEVSQQLALDVPREVNGVALTEYYDYPGPADDWLACLEPYEAGPNDYRWRQISDVTGYLNDYGWSTQDIEITNTPADPLFKAIIEDHRKIELDSNGDLREQLADADGDGVADSKWIKLPDLTSNQGKPIYAAIRVVDNGAMINVNTAYKFDPNGALTRIDGSSQLQMNLEALARGDPAPDADTIGELNVARGLPASPTDLDLTAYENGLIWRIEDPCNDYLPFDISDELTIRGRYIVKQRNTITRLKSVWEYAFDRSLGYAKESPYDASGDLPAWFNKSYRHLSDSNDQKYYNMPHISTTHNFDRIIDSDSNKMTNINTATVDQLYSAIIDGFQDADPNFIASNTAWQIAVNLIDYRDSDSNVTPYTAGPTRFYGFETPCIYISEVAHNFCKPDPNDPNIYRSYAVELYKPYSEDSDPNDPNKMWRLEVGSGNTILITNWNGNEQFFVLLDPDSNAPLTINGSPAVQYATFAFNPAAPGTLIKLQRQVGPASWFTVDSIMVPDINNTTGWLVDPPSFNCVERSLQRDIQPHKCIRRLWDLSVVWPPKLGEDNDYKPAGPDIQAHPANRPFTNVGEIGMLFCKDPYSQIGPASTEADVRVNLADPNFQRLFKYLTVFDPNEDNIDNDGDGLIDECSNPPVPGDELKIPGRININTAPWYVIEQLPWMRPEISQKIIEYRDGPLVEGFKSIGELMNVAEMYHYIDGNDLPGFPDLTAPDPLSPVTDDFEERDVIFSRISNLVTVRSDVFTAYILVRIGSDGPQKRVIAILDRSNVYPNPAYPLTSSIPYLGEVKVIAIHPVPDPR